MGRFGRHLASVTGLDQAGWLTLYGEIQDTFEEITGFDARMCVQRDGHTRLYFCLRQYCHVAGIGPSVCDRIFRVTPGVVAGGAPWAETSVAMNPAAAQIAQPAKPRRVSMMTSLLRPDRKRPGF